MSTVVGTWSLVRLILRLERLRLAIWVAVLALVPVGVANAFIGLYGTEASREELVASVAASPAITALLGPVHGSSIGALTAWRVGTIVALLAGIMTVSTIIRHTREDEEAGRREILGSTVVGRQAPLAAALTVAIGTGLLVGLVAAAGLIGVGQPMAGSFAFGLGLAGVAAAFAGVGAIAAQLTEGAGAARGMGIGAVGFFFLLRVAGDGAEASGLGWLSWLSPIGWMTRIRAFADEEWWVLLLWLGAALVTFGVAFVMSDRRDIAAGVFAPRPGPAEGASGLRNAFALAWRLQKGALLAWTVGLAAIGLVVGAVANSVADIFDENPQMAEVFQRLGGEQGVTDIFFSIVVGVVALVASAYSIRAVLRQKQEEDGLRAEPVLATPVTRMTWSGGHLAFGVLGPVVMLVVSAVVAGLAYGVSVGDVGGQVWRVVESAMVQVPAVWVVTGVVVVLYGFAPRLVAASWGFLVAFLLLGLLGQILQLPQWALDLSPFTHVPLLPAEDVEALPLLILLAVGVGLMVVGLTGFRRRDINAT